jgi:hypothetical protein
VNGVAIVLIIFCGVDTALGRNGMSAAWRILEAEGLHLVTEFAKGCCCGSSSEACTYDDDFEFAAIGGIDQLGLKLVVLPLFLERSGGNFGIKDEAHKALGEALVAKNLTLEMARLDVARLAI